MIEVTIPAQPSAADEGRRLDTFPWCDETPLGLYVTSGQQIHISVQGYSTETALSITAGFPPTWSIEPGKQEFPLRAGNQAVSFQVDGPVFIRNIGKGPSVNLGVCGGVPLALWDQSRGWVRRDEAGLAPWVQYVSDRVLITLPRMAKATQAFTDPATSFERIEQLLDWYDMLSGRTDAQGRHQPCRNRVHFLTDIWASEEAKTLFHMYAFHDYIAMLPDNINELTDPSVLQREWAIWHELGHLYQPHSWTWGAHVEVNVNIWSLFAQERFGQISRLETEPLHRETADRLLADGRMDVTQEGDPFVHLVMLERLRKAFGWGLFIELNRRYRDAPLPDDAVDSRKVQHFCRTVQDICGTDLSSFFRSWGVPPALCKPQHA